MIDSYTESRRQRSRLLAAALVFFFLPALSYGQALQPPVLLGPGASGTWGPTSFNDARFTGMANGTVGCGTASNRSQTTRNPNFCNGKNSFSFVRTDVTDDSLQMGTSADFTITDSYFHTCDLTGAADHADNIQSWVDSTMSLVVTRTMFDQTQSSSCDNVGTGIRNGDNGHITLLKLDHVYFKNGQGLRSYTPDGTPFAGMHVWLDSVCAEGTDLIIGAWNGGTITVDHYANVYNNCSIVNGQVVTGTPLKCSSVVQPLTGSVVGCP